MLKKITFGKPNIADALAQTNETVGWQILDAHLDNLGNYRKRQGLTVFTTITGSKPVTGIYESTQGVVYAVTNGKLYSVASNGTATEITGSGLSATNPAIFAEDADNIFIADGVKLSMHVKGAATYTQKTYVTGCSHVVLVKGYLIANGTISGGVAGDMYFNSNKGSSYPDSGSPTGWYTVNNEQLPDGLSTLLTNNGEVYALGPRSMETNYCTTSSPWWVPIQSAFISAGTANAYGAVLVGDSVIFPGIYDGTRHFLQVSRSQGTGVNVIDGPFKRIYDYLNSSNSLSTDCYAWQINCNGVLMYCVRLKTGSSSYQTFIYDLYNKVWYEWRYYNGSSYEHWLINSACYIQGWKKQLIGDRSNSGIIFEFTGLQDNAQPIGMELLSGYVSHGTGKKKLSRSLIIPTKRGTTASAVTAGSMNLYTKDDGAAFSSARSVSLGVSGDENPIPQKLSGMGSYHVREYKITHTGTDTDCIVGQMEEELDICAY